MKSLQKHIPSQFLPKEYDGQASVTLSNRNWRQYILQNAKYYETLENKFSNEEKALCNTKLKQKESCV